MSKTIFHSSAAERARIASVFTATLLLLSFLARTGDPLMASDMTSVSDTLSMSQPSLASNHTIAFTLPNGVSAGETVTVTFPAGFDLSDIVFTDIDFGSTTSDFTLAAAPSGATWGAAVSGQVLTLTNGNTAVGSTSSMVLRIGTNASVGATGANRIVNPGTEDSYQITIGGTIPDVGATEVAIVEGVALTAAVNTSLVFNVAGVAIGQTVNGSPTTTSTTTSATALPFGLLAPNQSKVVAQDLTVTTNANYGFTVTVQEDQNLTSSSGADIDLFRNGSSTATPVSWSAPTGVSSVEETYGHFGITSEDDHNGNEFGTDLWAGNFSSTSPRIIFSNSGPADGSTVNVGATRVGFQVQISPLQEAGSDYTNSLTYVVTPSF